MPTVSWPCIRNEGCLFVKRRVCRLCANGFLFVWWWWWWWKSEHFSKIRKLNQSEKLIWKRAASVYWGKDCVECVCVCFIIERITKIECRQGQREREREEGKGDQMETIAYTPKLTENELNLSLTTSTPKIRKQTIFEQSAPFIHEIEYWNCSHY